MRHLAVEHFAFRCSSNLAQFDFMIGLGITFNSSSISSNTGAMMTADS
jgi:hypothetical protein